MSTMRYVGARYVPKWYVNSVDQTADWEVNVEYEPLTWVTSQNNHLYLSKKTVPDNIGTPAQNTEYWLDMGQMTGDLQNIQDEIDAITANIGNLSNLDTTDKSNLVAAINEVVAGSGGATVTRKYRFYGDSYGTNYTIDNVNYTGWCDKMASIMGISSSLVSSRAASGYGFCGTNGTLQWKSWLSEESVDNEITDFVMVGGDNDIVFALTDLLTEMSDTIALAKTKFPKARIWLGFCAVDLSDDATRNIAAAFEIYSKGAAINGALFMPSIAYTIQDVGLLRMPSHPNNTGTDRLAAAISTVLLGGAYHAGIHTKLATQDNTDTVVVNSGCSERGDIYYSLHDNVINLGFRGKSPYYEKFLVKFGSNGVSGVVANLYNTTLNITKLTDVPIGHQGLIILGTVPGFAEWVAGGTHPWYPCSVLVCYYRGYIQLKLLDIDSSGYRQGTLYQVMMPACRFELPTDLYSSYL